MGEVFGEDDGRENDQSPLSPQVRIHKEPSVKFTNLLQYTQILSFIYKEAIIFYWQGAICLWGDQNFFGQSKGRNKLFFSESRGEGPEFLRVTEGGPEFFPKMGTRISFCIQRGDKKNWRPAITNRCPPNYPVKNDSSLQSQKTCIISTSKCFINGTIFRSSTQNQTELRLTISVSQLTVSSLTNMLVKSQQTSI